ncbi:hypothetical protein, partial [Ochrobactrum sp. AP1BH01-1]|uniref:hypothetical protein n=1 Tax=Ochrobactrum sp. AP1BH01-1 TaxID=2823874 RepID=UPI001B359CAE
HWIDFLTVSPHQAHNLKAAGSNPAPANKIPTNPSQQRRVLAFKEAKKPRSTTHESRSHSARR